MCMCIYQLVLMVVVVECVYVHVCVCKMKRKENELCLQKDLNPQPPACGATVLSFVLLHMCCLVLIGGNRVTQSDFSHIFVIRHF